MFFLLLLISCLSNKFVVKDKGFRLLERAIINDDRETFEEIISSSSILVDGFFDKNRDILTKLFDLEDSLEEDLTYYVEKLVLKGAYPFVDHPDKYKEVIKFGKDLLLLSSNLYVHCSIDEIKKILSNEREELLTKEYIKELLGKKYKDIKMIEALINSYNISSSNNYVVLSMFMKMNPEDTLEFIHMLIDSDRKLMLEILRYIITEENIELLWNKSLEGDTPLEKLVKSDNIEYFIENLINKENIIKILKPLNEIEKILNIEYKEKSLDYYLDFCIDNGLERLVRLITESEKRRDIFRGYEELEIEIKENIAEEEENRIILVLNNVSNLEDEEELMSKITGVKVEGQYFLEKVIDKIKNERLEEILKYKNNFIRKIMMEDWNKNRVAEILNKVMLKIGREELENVIKQKVDGKDVLEEAIDAKDVSKIANLIDYISCGDRLERALIEINSLKEADKTMLKKKILTKLTDILEDGDDDYDSF